MALNFLRKKQDKARSSSGAVYFQLKVKQVIQETEDTISILFENPGNKIQYKPGQFLTLIFKVNGEDIRRSYSLSTSPLTDDFLGVTVKRVDQGTISNFINEKIKPGDLIEAMEPKGNFTIDIDPAARRHLVLFAGGSGITPLYSIGRSVLLNEPGGKVTLVYQNRNEKSIIYKKPIQFLQSRYPGKFKVIHILSQPESGWTGLMGRITREDISRILNEIIAEKEYSHLFFTCGPHGMMETVIEQLHIMGIPNNEIHKESFVAPSTKAATHKETPMQAVDVKEHLVTILLDGEEYKVKVNPDRYILETALDANINMPFSCQSGLCTACRGKLKSGQVKMDNPDGLSDEELAQGYVLTCVSHPLTDNVVIEIG